MNFIYLSCEYLEKIEQNNGTIMICFPIEPSAFYTAPEILNMTELPSYVNYKTSYFSFGCLLLYALLENTEFYNEYIIYHVDPFTILTYDETVHYKKEINWNPWIKKYGKPGLSSNVFDIDGNRYILYHSYKSINGVNLKYYSGILKLNESLHPICYTSDSLFPSVEDYDRETFINYFNWKRKLHSCPTIVDVIFPMNVIVDDEYVNIYSGINDCICANIKIDKQLFINVMKNANYIIA